MAKQRIIKVRLYKHTTTNFWKLIVFKQRRKYENRYARYSHAELEFENGFSFSSSEQDGWIRYKMIEFTKQNWDYINIEVSEEQYDAVKLFCDRQVWNKYNWYWIVFAMALNINIKRKGDWFCSEIVTRALQEAHILCTESSLFVDPWKLALLLEENWYNIEV